MSDDFVDTMATSAVTLVFMWVVGLFIVALLHFVAIPYVWTGYESLGLSYWQAYVGYVVITFLVKG